MSPEPRPYHRKLPATAHSFDGAVFDPRVELWRFRSGLQAINIDFTVLNICDPALAASFRSLMLWYVQYKSTSLANCIYQRFLHFVRFHGSDGLGVEITAQQILRYRSALPEGQRWYLMVLAGAFRRWSDFSLSGISSDAQRLLENIRLKGNRKGEAVRTACPIAGPLSDIEFSGLVGAIRSAFRDGDLSRESYLLASLCIVFAARPVQLAALKTIDLLAPDEEFTTILRIPRAKQPSQGSRVTFTDRPLVPALARQFELHIAEVAGRLEGQRCPAGYPMFPAEFHSKTKGSPGLEWHVTSSGIYYRVRSAMEGVGVHSERTGLPLRLNPTRFRRTLGTRGAAQGYSEVMIAELLDHSDTQYVAVYVEARPDIIDRLDESVATALAPLANAFVGVIEDGAPLGDAPGGKIKDPRFGRSAPLGGCGTAGGCQLTAPTGCYTCTRFRAWRDGPHREVLEHLIRERSRLKELGSERVAAANDRAILAVAQVVKLCAETPDV